MSRIEQLVRPDRRRNGGRVAFPLIGLAAACLAFYAHAQIGQGKPAALPQPPAQDDKRVILRGNHTGAAFALVRQDGQSYAMSGSSSDMKDIEDAQRRLVGDFLWFRNDGKAYVVVDPATVGQARQAWAEADRLSGRMQALSREMETHSQHMEALSKQMEQVSSQNARDPAMDAAARRMDGLGRQQQALAARQMRLSADLITADQVHRDELARQMEALSQQQDALSRQMDEQSKAIDAASERMERQRQPLEVLGRQMEDAGKPMEALGQQMDTLGNHMDQAGAKAEQETWRLISNALVKGLAKPAPTRR